MRRLRLCDVHVLSLTVLGIGLVLLVVRRQSADTGMGSGGSGDKRDDDNDKDDSSDRNATDRFPWEPRDSQQENSQTQYSFEHEQVDPQQQLRDLDFLSAMTFANGGLRAPSCFCCR
jgi:hypothetical protein